MRKAARDAASASAAGVPGAIWLGVSSGAAIKTDAETTIVAFCTDWRHGAEDGDAATVTEGVAVVLCEGVTDADGEFDDVSEAVREGELEAVGADVRVPDCDRLVEWEGVAVPEDVFDSVWLRVPVALGLCVPDSDAVAVLEGVAD